MNLPFESVVRLIHEARHACLATHSREMPGYPFLSLLPFAPDERHRPVLLISRLAEHTKNLRSDTRASILIAVAASGDVQADPRLTLIGDIEPVARTRELTERFLRYQPAAELHLSLPDFEFHRLEPRTIRMVAGFGRMGWLDGLAFAGLDPLSTTREAELIADLTAELRSDMAILGIDRYGIDLASASVRRRVVLPGGPVADDALRAAACSALRAMPTLRDS